MQQEQALKLLKSGENIFLTGAAGTGKTYVLNQFIEWMRQENKRYAVTASTGIAATHLNGVTIHSWSGIGIKHSLGRQHIENLKRHIKINYYTTQVLIIDEISMLHAHQLDMIDTIAKQLLDKTLPFGGIQVILCGDFCQLPPVANNNNEDIIFAYEAKSWVNGDIKVCYLEEQFRQNEDDGLIDILNAIRNNEVDHDIRTKLNELNTIHESEQITKLYINNIDVDKINDMELAKIKGKVHKFEMNEFGDRYLVEGLKKRCLAKETLKLKVGAFVIFIKNDRERRYVNGTLGIVKGFTNYGVPIVTTRDNETIYVTLDEWIIEDHEGRLLARISQIPLSLAWAITVHKSQGMTLDAAEIDLRKAFCYGMGYVALSRVRNSSGLKLLGFNEKSLQIDPKMLDQDKIFRGVK